MRKHTTHGLLAALAALLLLLSGWAARRTPPRAVPRPQALQQQTPEVLPNFPLKSFGASPSP